MSVTTWSKYAARYGLALISSALALVLALAADPLTRLSPFVLFYAAVAVSSWYGGAGPGLVAIALGACAAAYFVLPPVGSFYIERDGEAARLLLFVLVGALVALLYGQLHNARARWASEARAARIGEARAKRLAESNLIAVFFADLGGKVRWGNDAFLRLVGIKAEELTDPGLNWRDLTAPEHSDRDDRAVAELRACRVCKPFEKDQVHRDRRRVPVLMGCAMLEAVEEQCVGFILDLTERKRAEDEVRAHQDRLHALASERLRAEERERRRVAAVLHDSVSATLALAKRGVAELRPPVVGDNGARAAKVTEIERMLTEAIDRTRSLTSELSPPVLYELGLVPAFRWLCDRFTGEHGLNCDVEDDPRPKPVTDEVRLVLFQAVRELLVNAVKHARARRCLISVRRANGGIEVAVADDGVGFGAAAAENAGPSRNDGGFGLFNIRERLAYLGGRLTVDSQPRVGSTVTLFAPLALEQAKPAHVQGATHECHD